MRKASLLIAALALTSACSDDNDKKPALDITLMDHSNLVDSGPRGDGAGATTNSGQICSNSQPCPNPTQEACFFFGSRDGGAATGATSMCLGMCAKIGDVCSVANPSTQRAVCYANYQSQHYCLYLCQAPETPGSVVLKDYKCPNDTDYVCTTYGGGGTSSDYKYCLPK